jgi:hypothetical protein
MIFITIIYILRLKKLFQVFRDGVEGGEGERSHCVAEVPAVRSKWRGGEGGDN